MPEHRLTLLGSSGLVGDDGQAVEAVLQQPRRFALLAYLVVETLDGPVRRDRIVSVFWPESAPSNGRSSLSQALYYLRKALGADVLVNRGSEEVDIDHSLLASDVGDLREAGAADEWKAVCDLYRGAFLDGFHAPGAPPELDQWLDRTRATFQGQAADAAWSLADAAEARGDDMDAVVWARRACSWLPRDEAAVRRLMAQLDRLGDRAGVVEAYRTLERQLAPLEAEPTPKTKQLLEELKDHWVREDPAPETAALPVREAVTAAAGQSEDGGSPAASPRPRWGLMLLLLPVVLLMASGAGEERSPANPLAPAATVVVGPFSGEAPRDVEPVVLRSAIVEALQDARGLAVVVQAQDGEDLPESPGPVYTLDVSVARAGPGVSLNLHLLAGGTREAIGSTTLTRPLPLDAGAIDGLAMEAAGFARHTLGQALENEILARSSAPPEAIRRLAEARRLTREAAGLRDKRLIDAARAGFARADSLLAIVTEEAPTWPVGWATRAESHIARGWVEISPGGGGPPAMVDWLEEALRCADRALDLRPGYSDALAAKGRSQHLLTVLLPAAEADRRRALQAAAEETARRLTQVAPHRVEGWRMLSSILTRQANFEEAYWALRQALEVDTHLRQDQEVILNLQRLAMEVGDGDGAVEWCDAVRRGNLDPFGGAHCALMLQAHGYVPVDTTAISTEMDRARQSNLWPGPKPLLEATAAVLYARAGHPERAREILRRLDTTATNPESLHFRAWGWVAAGDTARARRLLNAYVRNDPVGREMVFEERRFEALR